jgi:PhzF family phenazine biosynthesis protein
MITVTVPPTRMVVMAHGGLDVVHLDVFARGAGGGNPCPIIGAAGDLTTTEMQAIAAHYGEETGFIGHDDDGTVRLRFFVPRHEMSMCVHATVAALTVLIRDEQIDGSATLVRTDSGDCQVSWREADPPQVTVEQQRPVIGPPLGFGGELVAAAGLAPGSIDPARPIRSVSVSRAKLMVPLRRAADVHAAAPDYERLWALCRSVDTTGLYLFAPHDDGRPDHVVARQFPVDAGYPEDPATGVAAGALAAYLAQPTPSPGWQQVDIDQGDAMGRPSRLHAAAFADAEGVHRSTVTGTATIRRRERLDVAALVG